MHPVVTEQQLPEFAPGGLLANRHVQSLANSSAPRKLLIHHRAREFRHGGEQWILDGGGGVRLLGFYNRHKERHTRGLVILFHGWEGSSDSNYILSTGNQLFNAGYDVFRLNFRDHGPSHHLNREIFHSNRLDEVVNAVADICGKIETRPVYLAGFSLGGNFALRTGLRAPALGIPLARIIAVCPVIVPVHVLDSLESGPAIYHRYFVKKWQTSLRIKQKYFPGQYEFSEWFRISGLKDQTQFLVERYTDYESVQAYFDGYSLHGDRLVNLEVPTTIIASRDDPVIPYSDFEGLVQPPSIKLVTTQNGGHCSFMKDWRFNSWIDQFMEAEVEAAQIGAGRGN